jgi:hypothetical protein
MKKDIRFPTPDVQITPSKSENKFKNISGIYFRGIFVIFQTIKLIRKIEKNWKI